MPKLNPAFFDENNIYRIDESKYYVLSNAQRDVILYYMQGEPEFKDDYVKIPLRYSNVIIFDGDYDPKGILFTFDATLLRVDEIDKTYAEIGWVIKVIELAMGIE